MTRAKGDDAGQHGLEPFGDEGLQHVAFNGQAHASLGHEAARGARDGAADFACTDEAFSGLHAQTFALFDLEAGDLAILEDVDPVLVGAARVTPGHRVMAHRAAAPLRQTALDGEAGVVEIEERVFAFDRVEVEIFGIRAVQLHRVAAPDEGVALRVGMDQVHDPALADHGVVVEILLKAFPKLEGKLVEGLIAVEQVIGADNGGVAPHIAAADPAFLDHRDFLLAENFRQIMGRGQPVPAAADDDDVVMGLRLRVAPGGRPAFMARQGLFDDFETGVAHGIRPSLHSGCRKTGLSSR